MIQKDYERQLLQMLKADLDDQHNHDTQTDKASDPVHEKFHDVSKAELRRILAAHVKWLESDGKAGQRANFSKVNLRGANLASVNLQRANLAGADLLWINSFGAELQGADLSGADLRESYLEEANLKGAILEGANLQDAYLAGANLQGADLKQANLQQANLQRADLKDAILFMANLQNAKLENARLMNANLSFANMQHANLKHAKISYADLKNTDLTEVTGLATSQLSTVKNLSQAKLGAEIKKQFLNRPEPPVIPAKPKASLPVDAAEKKPLKKRQQNDNNLRIQPRKPFTKSVFIASQDQYCKGLIKNINSFGAFIETTTQFYRRQTIKLEIPGTNTDNNTLIIGEVARSDLHGIGIRFKKLIHRNRFNQDMGGMRSGTDRRKLLFSEYYPEKRAGADRRCGVDRRKLKYFKYDKYGLQRNRILDNGGRRSTRDRRQQSFGLYWPENRKGKDRRGGEDRRSGTTKNIALKSEPPKRTFG